MSVAARARARRSPPKTLFVSSAISTSSAMLTLGIQKLARDHQPLDLAGPFANGAEFYITVELFHRVILQEAVAAVNLHRLVGYTHRRLRGEQLGHRRFLVHVLAAVLHPRRALREQAGGVDIRRHVCQLVLDRLELRNEAPELLALFGITQR